MRRATAHFEELFFSTGVLPHGSVKEYYAEVDPRPRRHHRRGRRAVPDAADAHLVRERQLRHRPPADAADDAGRDLAHDAAVAADPDVNFAPYDNDGNGFVDAFIVVHAGSGGEQTGNPGDIWSHKWTLPSVVRRRTRRRSSPT